MNWLKIGKTTINMDNVSCIEEFEEGGVTKITTVDGYVLIFDKPEDILIIHNFVCSQCR